MNVALNRQQARWYDLKDIPEQVRLVTEDTRFKVVPAGRVMGGAKRKRFFGTI